VREIWGAVRHGNDIIRTLESFPPNKKLPFVPDQRNLHLDPRTSVPKDGKHRDVGLQKATALGLRCRELWSDVDGVVWLSPEADMLPRATKLPGRGSLVIELSSSIYGSSIIVSADALILGAACQVMFQPPEGYGKKKDGPRCVVLVCKCLQTALKLRI
jgi:hypothetical protein